MTLTPVSLHNANTLQTLTRGQQLQTPNQTAQIAQSHLVVNGTGETQRIAVEDYLARPQRYAIADQNTRLEIQLASGQSLSIPLAELSQSRLQAALEQALSSITPQEAERNYRAASSLLEQVRHRPPPPAGPEDLVAFISSHFQALDLDGDEWISKAELQAALQRPEYTEAQKALLYRALANLSDLEEYSNDEWGDENDGITRADLQVFLEQAQSGSDDPATQSLSGRVTTADGNAARAYQLFSQNMYRLDRDSDGFVTREDLQAASQNTRFSETERAWFAHLSTQVGEIEELSNDEWFDENDGITLRDLEAFVRSHVDHGIHLPNPHPEIRGDLNLQLRDANGLNRPGRNDISGQISGSLTLDRAVIDDALSQLREQKIPYVSIANTAFNPQSQQYEISISTPVDDFQVRLGVDPRHHLPYLELSENWLPDDPILQLIQTSVRNQLGQQAGFADLPGLTGESLGIERRDNRLYLIPHLDQLRLPMQNRHLALEDLQLRPENVRYAFDRDGNFVLNLQRVPVQGSSDSHAPNESEERATGPADEANLHLRLGVDLNEQYRVQGEAVDLEVRATLHLNPSEQEELAGYLRQHLDAELVMALMQLLYTQHGEVNLEHLRAGFSLDAKGGPIEVRVEGANLYLSQQAQEVQSIDLTQFQTLISECHAMLNP